MTHLNKDIMTFDEVMRNLASLATPKTKKVYQAPVMCPLQAKPSKKQSRTDALGLNGKMCGAEGNFRVHHFGLFA